MNIIQNCGTYLVIMSSNENKCELSIEYWRAQFNKFDLLKKLLLKYISDKFSIYLLVETTNNICRFNFSEGIWSELYHFQLIENSLFCFCFFFFFCKSMYNNIDYYIFVYIPYKPFKHLAVRPASQFNWANKRPTKRSTENLQFQITFGWMGAFVFAIIIIVIIIAILLSRMKL